MDNLIEKSCLFICNTLYYQTIFCAILFIIIFGITCFLRGKSPRLLLGLWLLILIRLFLPTDLNFSFSAANLLTDFPLMERMDVSTERISNKLTINRQPYQYPALDAAGSTEAQKDNGDMAEGDFVDGRNKKISWPIILTIVWLSGCLITFTLFFNKIRRIHRVLDHSSLVREKDITAFIKYWRLCFKIKRPVKAYSSDEFLSPFTVGLFRPKIFIPRPLLETSGNKTINAIIAHEMVHIKRFDYVWIRFQNALQIIYFFHPVVWYANRQINMARERVCDSIVLEKRVISSHEYGKSVIDVLKFNVFGYRLIDPLPCFNNHKKIFRQRIKDIIKQRAITKPKTLFILLMVFLLGLFLLPMSNSQTNNIQREKVSENNVLELNPPVEGYISSVFHFVADYTNLKEFYNGLKIGTYIGTPIHAAASGTVEKVELDEFLGETVTLLHNDNYKTVYALCDDILVQEGQHVESGEVIAKVGNSALLHFALIKDGIAVNPPSYFDIAAKPLRIIPKKIEDATPSVTDPEVAAGDSKAVTNKDAGQLSTEQGLSETELYDSGKQAFDNEQYKVALERFKKFLAQYPESENADNAQFWVGEIYYREKWYAGAILEYQKVIENDPNGNKVPASLYKQGLSFFNIGEEANARTFLEYVVNNYPTSNEAKFAREKLGILTDPEAAAVDSKSVTGMTGKEKPISNIQRTYYAEVAYNIQRNWAFSDQMTGSEKDPYNEVVIKIQRDGTIEDILFERKSGNSHFNDSTYKAILESSPLPPIPDGISGTSLTLGLRFVPEGLK